MISVIFVHGLNGHPQNTWTADRTKTFWLHDLLPNNVKREKARILTYGYNAVVYAFMGSASSERVHHHAQNLIANVHANRSASILTVLWSVVAEGISTDQRCNRASPYICLSFARRNYCEKGKAIFSNQVIVCTYAILRLFNIRKG